MATTKILGSEITASLAETASYALQVSSSQGALTNHRVALLGTSDTTAIYYDHNGIIYNASTNNLSVQGAVIASTFTGSLSGTASFASTASFVNPLNQNVTLTGSLRGQVSTLTISSNTASVNMSSNNFFTLALVNGANTHINPTNINPGQTVNIRVTQGSLGTGTVSFPSFVDQASGSLYTGSMIANAIDIVTMITFDSTNVYLSSIRNMI